MYTSQALFTVELHGLVNLTSSLVHRPLLTAFLPLDPIWAAPKWPDGVDEVVEWTWPCMGDGVRAES